MAEPMSDERLAKIRSRAAAATPGPWTWSPGMIKAPGANEHFSSEIVMWVGNIPGEYDDDDAAAALGACGTHAEEDAAANLAFLAAAREDVPALLAEVERLRGELDETRNLAQVSLDILLNVSDEPMHELFGIDDMDELPSWFTRYGSTS